MLTNKELLDQLFDMLIRVIGQSTSHSYAVTNLSNIIKNYMFDFPFLKNIDLGVEAGQINIVVEKYIDDTNRQELTKFITKLLSSLFVVDAVRNVVKNNLATNNELLYQELTSMGVIF